MFNASLQPTYLLRIAVVVLSVGICAGVLFAVQPWRASSNSSEHSKASQAALQGQSVSSPHTKMAQDAPTKSQTVIKHAEAVKDEAKDKDTEVSTAQKPENETPDTADAEPPKPSQSESPATVVANLTDDPAKRESEAISHPTPSSSVAMSTKETDEALKPLLAFDIPEGEKDELKTVVSLVRKEKYDSAKKHLAKIKNKTAKKLASEDRLFARPSR